MQQQRDNINATMNIHYSSWGNGLTQYDTDIYAYTLKMRIKESIGAIAMKIAIRDFIRNV